MSRHNLSNGVMQSLQIPASQNIRAYNQPRNTSLRGLWRKLSNPIMRNRIVNKPTISDIKTPVGSSTPRTPRVVVTDQKTPSPLDSTERRWREEYPNTGDRYQAMYRYLAAILSPETSTTVETPRGRTPNQRLDFDTPRTPTNETVTPPPIYTSPTGDTRIDIRPSNDPLNNTEQNIMADLVSRFTDDIRQRFQNVPPALQRQLIERFYGSGNWDMSQTSGILSFLQPLFPNTPILRSDDNIDATLMQQVPARIRTQVQNRLTPAQQRRFLQEAFPNGVAVAQPIMTGILTKLVLENIPGGDGGDDGGDDPGGDPGDDPNNPDLDDGNPNQDDGNPELPNQEEEQKRERIRERVRQRQRELRERQQREREQQQQEQRERKQDADQQGDGPQGERDAGPDGPQGEREDDEREEGDPEAPDINNEGEQQDGGPQPPDMDGDDNMRDELLRQAKKRLSPALFQRAKTWTLQKLKDFISDPNNVMVIDSGDDEDDEFDERWWRPEIQHGRRQVRRLEESLLSDAHTMRENRLTDEFDYQWNDPTKIERGRDMSETNPLFQDELNRQRLRYKRPLDPFPHQYPREYHGTTIPIEEPQYQRPYSPPRKRVRNNYTDSILLEQRPSQNAVFVDRRADSYNQSLHLQTNSQILRDELLDRRSSMAASRLRRSRHTHKKQF